MNKTTSKIFTPKSIVIALCDLAIVNALCILTAYVVKYDFDWIGGLIIANSCLFVIVKYLGMRFLGYNWLDSILNRIFKQLTDIVIALFFLTTIFPIIFVLGAITIRTKRGGAIGSILEIRTATVNDANISLLFFRKTSTVFDHPFLNKMPNAFNILLGKISLWDSCKEINIEVGIEENIEEVICKDNIEPEEEPLEEISTSIDINNINIEEERQDSPNNNQTSNYEHIQ